MSRLQTNRTESTSSKTIYAEDGKGTIGVLKNGVLHMNRVYEKHHFRREPGWGIDKKAMDNHLHEINAIVLHCKRKLDGVNVDQLLTYTIDFENDIIGRDKKELIFNIIDFAGHGAQYLIPDNRWEAQMHTILPEDEVQLPVSPPIKDLPNAGSISYDSVKPASMRTIDDSYVKINPAKTNLAPKIPTFTFTEIYPFLKKGYAFYEKRLGEGFYIQYEGNVLKVKHDTLPFDMPYAFDPNSMDASHYSLKLDLN